MDYFRRLPVTGNRRERDTLFCREKVINEGRLLTRGRRRRSLMWNREKKLSFEKRFPRRAPFLWILSFPSISIWRMGRKVEFDDERSKLRVKSCFLLLNNSFSSDIWIEQKVDEENRVLEERNFFILYFQFYIWNEFRQEKQK